MIDDDDDDRDKDAPDFDDTDAGSSDPHDDDDDAHDNDDAQVDARVVDEYRGKSGFVDDSVAPSCRCRIVVDESVTPGTVRITRAVAHAIAVRGAGRAYANVFAGPQPTDASPEEKLLQAIFGDKPADLTVHVVDGAPVRRRMHLMDVRDGWVGFFSADEGVVARVERIAQPTKKIVERAVVHLTWTPPIEVGDVLLADNQRALGVIVGIDERASLQIAVSPFDAKGIDDVDVHVSMPQARERIVARSIGAYSLVTGRPIGDVVRIHPGHVTSLIAHGCEQLVDEVAWRTEASNARPALYEAIVKGEDPLDTFRARMRDTPEMTRALKQLRALAAALGVGIDVDDRGIAIFFANLGASADGEAPPAREQHETNANANTNTIASSNPTANANANKPADIFSFFDKPKPLPRLDRAFVDAWSHGEVKKPETLNYRTLKPEPGGLFCQRIFGPIKDFECACGKYKRMKHRGIVCEKCGVEVLSSTVRAERMGHVALPLPVLPWPLRNLVAAALGDDADAIVESMWSDGGASLLARLRALPPTALPFAAEHALWRVMPVLPPDHRPLVALGDGRFATSDLNDLYRRVINRSNRARRLLELNAPAVIVQNEHRELQQAVDAVLANSEQTKWIVGPNKRRLVDAVSLFLDALRPSPRAVDYGARASIIVDDSVPASSLFLPYAIASEILRPWLYARLEGAGLVGTIKEAKKRIDEGGDDARAHTIAEAVGRALLVCAHHDESPHGARIAGATVAVVTDEPVLRVGRALADALAVSTGDEIAVHLPLSRRASVEVKRLIEAPPTSHAHAHAHADVAGGWLERTLSVAPRKRGVASRSADLVDEALRGSVDATSLAARLLLLRAR